MAHAGSDDEADQRVTDFLQRFFQGQLTSAEMERFNNVDTSAFRAKQEAQLEALRAEREAKLKALGFDSEEAWREAQMPLWKAQCEESERRQDAEAQARGLTRAQYDAEREARQRRDLTPPRPRSCDCIEQPDLIFCTHEQVSWNSQTFPEMMERSAEQHDLRPEQIAPEALTTRLKAPSRRIPEDGLEIISGLQSPPVSLELPFWARRDPTMLKIAAISKLARKAARTGVLSPSPSSEGTWCSPSPRLPPSSAYTTPTPPPAPQLPPSPPPASSLPHESQTKKQKLASKQSRSNPRTRSSHGISKRTSPRISSARTTRSSRKARFYMLDDRGRAVEVR